MNLRLSQIIYKFRLHTIHNQVLKTEKWIHVAESVFGDQHLSYNLKSIITNICTTVSVAVWILAVFLFTSAVLISATQIRWPWYLGRVNADLGHWYRLLHSLSVCCLLQLKSKHDPAQLHSRPRCGTVAIGEECGHNWSRNFLSYLTVSLHCHGCISL